MAYRSFLQSKIHRATITGADVDYEGSIAIDTRLLEAAGILPFERVEVYNVDNGERLATYAIPGTPGQICLNGAAALKGQPGQRVIIATYTLLGDAEIAGHRPKVVLVNPDNTIKGDTL